MPLCLQVFLVNHYYRPCLIVNHDFLIPNVQFRSHHLESAKENKIRYCVCRSYFTNLVIQDKNSAKSNSATNCFESLMVSKIQKSDNQSFYRGNSNIVNRTVTELLLMLLRIFLLGFILKQKCKTKYFWRYVNDWIKNKNLCSFD